MQSLLNKFSKIIDNQKLSHLYLVVGSALSQRKEFVLELTYRILKTKDTNFPSKDSLLNAKYPNFYYLTKESHLFHKEQILQFKKAFSQTSLFGKQRIYVIEEIEKISTQASNSLLYFLENPSNNIIGFLLTSNLAQVLPTIISRCQVIHMPEYSDLHLQIVPEKDTLKAIDSFDRLLSDLIVPNFSRTALFIQEPYYQNFKSFFIYFLEYFCQFLSFNFSLFAYSLVPILSSAPHFMNDFLLVLLRWFLDIVYDKLQLPVYFVYQTHYQKPFRILTLQENINILNIIQKNYQQKNAFFNQQNLLISFLIELEKQKSSF